MIALDALAAPRPLLRVAVIGLGGFAADHHRALLELEKLGESRLVATCDPHPERFTDECERWGFAARGVRVFDDYLTLLDACAGELDLVIIPTPIALHAEMHRAAVARGVPVYLEKPPTLDPDELEAMIATDRAAAKTSLVGFNYVTEPGRLALKRRILAGEFGALAEVHLLGRCPRAAGYYARNDWAGRLRTTDGRLLLDSCFSNAMGHYVQACLCWAGPAGEDDWASPVEVRAELYRSHPLEGADTVFAQARTAGGVELRVALSHACSQPQILHETLVLEKAVIRYVVDSHYEITWHDGRVDRTALPLFATLIECHQEHYRYLRGEASRPATRLEDCRPFVHFNGLAYVSSGAISPFPGEGRRQVYDEQVGCDYLMVPGLEEALGLFLAEGRWPGSHPPRAVTPADLDRLDETIRRIESESQGLAYSK